MKIINWILIIVLLILAQGVFRQGETIGIQRKVINLQEGLISRQAAYIGEIEGLLDRTYKRDVTITAYTASASECDGSPHQTAMMTRPRAGTVAVSRDLFDDGWTFGKKVYIAGHGVFTIGDLMAERHTESIDMFMGSRREAVKFGRGVVRAVLIM